VEVLVSRLDPRSQAVIYFITQVVSLALFAVLAYQSILLGNSLRAAGEVSMTIRIPFYPVLYAISFSSWVVCLVLLVELVRVVAGRAKAWHRWET
jgi:TRAP-type C4-dicarboxylate transport system permease small subunit